MSRQRQKGAQSSSTYADVPLNSKPSNGSVTQSNNPPPKVGVSQIAPALVDLYAALGLVLGGCCSNVLAYEQLLLLNPRIGSALTFSQMVFISLQCLPSFLAFHPSSFLPRLKPRQVPLQLWGLQVLVLTAGNLLNNWAYAYNVPLTILIVFRSAGLPISMLFGFLFLKRKYSFVQMASIAIVTAGVVLATLSRMSPDSGASSKSTQNGDDLTKYMIGIGMMVVSLLCTGVLGLMQERTYRTYGPCWKEGMFYTHCLSLPAFFFLRKDIEQGFSGLLGNSSSITPMRSLVILAGNLFTQLICVSGVNRLTSQVSSVSTNIALTARKALSLCFSVWWFGNEWNARLAVGACMVFFGSLLYSLSADNSNKSKKE